MLKTPSLDLTVITPMYNEAAQIQNNIDKIVDALSGMDVTWEYILVNDGSLDNSLELAEEAMTDCECCRIIHYPRNRGRGYALRQGFAAAKGRYIITTESDLSWGESIIPQLYAAISHGDADVVIASVNLPGGKLANVPAHRVALSKVSNQVLHFQRNPRRDQLGQRRDRRHRSQEEKAGLLTYFPRHSPPLGRSVSAWLAQSIVHHLLDIRLLGNIDNNPRYFQ